MAGLLLGTANVLVLDEPGNHLDVETVEALAEALLEYKGTVIFTSHDRHFMHRVATSVIEVRDGSVKNYFGDYDTYLVSVENEVDDGERDAAGTGQRQASVPLSPGKAAGPGARPPHVPKPDTTIVKSAEINARPRKRSRILRRRSPSWMTRSAS